LLALTSTLTPKKNTRRAASGTTNSDRSLAPSNCVPQCSCCAVQTGKHGPSSHQSAAPYAVSSVPFKP
jgi:hypothetical protein